MKHMTHIFILSVSQFNIPGKFSKEKHSLNMLDIFSKLLIFHLDISGIGINYSHLLNIPFIL